MLSEDTIKLILEATDSGSLDDLTRKLEKHKKSVEDVDTSYDKLEKSTEKAKGSTADFGRTALESGRILQDFAQGGIGGILNNIEGFTRALGGGPGAAGVMTAFGLAVYFAIPIVKEFWKEWTEGSNKIPESTDKLTQLHEQLDKNKKRLEELRKEQTLSNTELKEYNKLLGDTKTKESELEAEQKRVSEAKKARAEKTPEEADLGTAFTKISGGAAYDTVVGKVVEGMEAKGGVARYYMLKRRQDAMHEKFAKTGQQTPEEAREFAALGKEMNEIARQTPIMGTTAETPRLQAEALVQRARAGDAAAFDEIGGLGGITLRQQMQGIDPRLAGRRQLGAERARGQIGDVISDVLGPVITRFREQHEANKIGGQLTEQGRDIERRTFQERDRDRDQDARKAARDTERDTAEHRNREAIAANRNAMMERMQGIDRANQERGGQAASPEFLEQATTAALQNVTAGADIGSAVRFAIQQTQAKIMADFQQTMMRQAEQEQAQWQQMNGMNMFNPTVMGR